MDLRSGVASVLLIAFCGVGRLGQGSESGGRGPRPSPALTLPGQVIADRLLSEATRRAAQIK